MSLSPAWPFHPNRLPFFYGWVIFVLSTLGILCSIPGQTMGMAVFTEPLIEALGLTRTQLSLAYLAGTVGSSLFLTRAGRWYDIYGGRVMITIAAAALGVMLVYIANADRIARLLGGSMSATFAVIMLGYFGVRFFGQGVLTSCSRNVLLMWFERHRGKVTGARGIIVTLGFSLAPPLLATLIALYGWRGALLVSAIAVGAVFALTSLLLVRDRPADIAQFADGDRPVGNAANARAASGATPGEARRTPVFWLYTLALAYNAMFGTALTFHVVAVFAEAGLGAERALAYFFPMALFSTSCNLIASWLVDRYPLQPFLLVMLAGYAVGATGVLNLDLPWGFWVLCCGMGIGGGLWGMLSNLANVRYFGARHLGEISGLTVAVSVFASATGPALFSLGFDITGSFHGIVWLSLCLVLALVIAAVVIPQREPAL